MLERFIKASLPSCLIFGNLQKMWKKEEKENKEETKKTKEAKENEAKFHDVAEDTRRVRPTECPRPSARPTCEAPGCHRHAHGEADRPRLRVQLLGDGLEQHPETLEEPLPQEEVQEGRQQDQPPAGALPPSLLRCGCPVRLRRHRPPRVVFIETRPERNGR